MKHGETLEQFLTRAAAVLFPNREFDGEPKVLTIRSKSCDGDMPLHTAALWGDRHAVNLLLDAGADIDAKGDMSCTALYFAVMNNHVQAAEALLLRGANPDADNEFQSPPRKLAIEKGNPDMIALFKSRKIREC